MDSGYPFIPSVPSSAGTKHLLTVLSALAVLIPSCTTSQSSMSKPICHGVQVRPGSNLQARIESEPSGTSFCFAKGMYLLSDTIWTGRKSPTLDLRAGAVIDGGNGGFIGINGFDGSADKRG